MNMFNTDSGFRPPSPLAFTPSQGLFGEPLAYEDFRFSNPDFLALPNASPALPGDPSLQLFNPSEQRYFSEFLDTLVVDQDFTFDPSSIPNLPQLPLFNQESLPGFSNNNTAGNSLNNIPYMLPTEDNSHTTNNSSNSNNPMDYDMAMTEFNSGAHQASVHFGRSEALSGSSSSPGHPTSYVNAIPQPVSVPTKRRSNKATETSSPSRRGTPLMGEGHSHEQKISTPIQQLSKLSLNNTHTQTGNGNSNNGNSNNGNSSNSNGGSSKKSKREEEQHQIKEESRERNASVSDEYGSDAGTSSGTPTSHANGTANSTTPSTTNPKRKPYKELLTEEEKRANHIASEQKRRNTIRNGFKDMTDIIPDLKDVNSSKSTILFKAVDFIKHLEKRNRQLQEKAQRLEARLQGQQHQHQHPHQQHQSQRHDQRLQDIPHIYPVPGLV